MYVRDIQDFVFSALDKLDQVNINLERIAKALESNNNQKISTEKEKKRLFESTATKKASQKEGTSSNYTYYDVASLKTHEYTVPSNAKLVPDGYHLEHYIDPSKFTCSAGTSALTYSPENLEYKIK